MARLAPDAILAQSNLLGTVLNIQDDPDAPDGLWLAAVDNGVSTDLRVSFPSPGGTLDGVQEVRVLVRSSASGGSTPTAVVELWEAGAVKTTLVPSTAVTSTAGVVLSGTFTSAYLSDPTGASVEVRVNGIAPGGKPADRRSIGIGAIEWNATVGATPPPKGGASGGYGVTGTATGTAPVIPQAVGSASGTYGFTATASGTSPAVATSSGTAAGTFGFTGTSHGTHTASGDAAGGYAYSGTTHGTTAHRGAVGGSYAYASAATGSAPTVGANGGAAVGAFGYAGSSIGVRRSVGTAAGSVRFDGSATGATPGVARTSGTTAGTFTYAATASGTRSSRGATVGSYAYTGTALGTAHPQPVPMSDSEPTPLPAHQARNPRAEVVDCHIAATIAPNTTGAQL